MPESRPKDGTNMKETAMTETEAIVEALEDHATILWGPERAANLQASIQLTAANIARLQGDLPALDEEPAFYLPG